MSKNKQNFSTQVGQKLAGSPKELEGMKALFFVKGVLLILMAIALYLVLGGSGWLVYFYAAYMVINGLIMIVTNLLAAKADSSYRIMALVVGGISIIFGALPIIMPGIFGPGIFWLLILGICLDTFFTLGSVIFLSKKVDRIWWAIGGGSIGIVTLIGVCFYSQSNPGSWLAIYAALTGIYYCSLPFLFAQSKNSQVAIKKNKSKKR